MSPAESALALVDAYYAAFNARDIEGFAATFHYPHLTLGPGEPVVMRRGDHTAAFFTGGALAEWDWSELHSRAVVHASDNKVHVAARFTRHRKGGGTLGVYDVLYVITREGGRWGMKAMSGLPAEP